MQAILDELGARSLDSQKRKDLVNRLNDEKRPEQTLGAEYELIVFWMLSADRNFELEPHWCFPTRPDAYSQSIFLGNVGELSEITALDNSKTKQEGEMRSSSQRMVDAANRIKKGTGQYLFFTYLEEWERINHRRVRVRQVPLNLEITPYIRQGLHDLLLGELKTVRLKEGNLDVVIERRERRQHHLFNFHSSVPPEAKSLTDNPIFYALKRKREQLVSASTEYKRVIWLCDAGSDILRACGTVRHMQSSISAEQIIQNFLLLYQDIDLVIVLSPRHSNSTLGQSRENWWHLSHFTNNDAGAQLDVEWLQKACLKLPSPRFAGYQARQLVQQRAYGPTAKGWYTGVTYRSKDHKGSVEISSRLVIDLLARRITPEQFAHFMGDRDGQNLFARMLDAGMTFEDITFQSGGIDEDDDKIVLHYSDDPSASKFK
ncbi:hypothetical protein [Devosia sp.]|uniref:hypothetical protein n=1 Tax=Devosia sp. TaxID=1871048 RepID=UPI0025DA9938|nr:hypothetical protein [Devosia sp.]MCR6635112.1 hypothetical protein [Devosia sp.]